VAKDIVQDSWSVIWRKLPLLKDPNAFGSWAFRIVTRRALNYVSKHKNSAIPLGEKEPKFMEVESTEEQHLQHNRLKSAISKLSEDQQMVLRLFYIEAYSLRENQGKFDCRRSQILRRIRGKKPFGKTRPGA